MSAGGSSWLEPQAWERDADQPCLSLGAPGAFDDMHVFAPCVAVENGRYRMWYCGSRGEVGDRVFSIGLATSTDGVRFTRYGHAPVYSFGDGRHSVLTPTLLRGADGSVLRESGRLRMWFAAADLTHADARHTLHDSTSADGMSWTTPSAPLLADVYAPTVLRIGDSYHMWYADVASDPWCIRYVRSADGRTWDVTPEPALVIDQEWERGRLFYPTVLRAGDVFVMWYGSYDARRSDMMTALGVAVSDDGLRWRKSARNPVFEPHPTREWESHFTTSQSIMPLEDGSLRIWYAARTKPPFAHKYYAVGTARWGTSPIGADRAG